MLLQVSRGKIEELMSRSNAQGVRNGARLTGVFAAYAPMSGFLGHQQGPVLQADMILLPKLCVLVSLHGVRIDHKVVGHKGDPIASLHPELVTMV